MVSTVQELLEEGSLPLPGGLKSRPAELELEFEGHQRYELDLESHPHILSLHIKCKQGHLKVLRAYQRVECWVVRREGQVEPLELLVCDLVKHDMGRGFWTYFTRVKALPGPDTVVRLRLSEIASEEVNA